MKAALLKSLDEVLAYANPGVVERIAKEMKISLEEAGAVFQDTLRFLYLAAETGEVLAPTKRIDAGWHAFLLFTQDYSQFCQQNLGRFLHHCPRTSQSPPIVGDLASKTFELAVKRFGPDLSINWKYDLSQGAECSKSGCNCSPGSGGGGSDCTPD